MPTSVDKRLSILPATNNDLPVILQLIKDLAEYERLAHEVVATEEVLAETLFGEHPYAEVLIARYENEPVGYALFFHSYSTFLGRPGIYLEDLFVKPHCRGKGIGKALLACLAQLALERKCGRLEWAVLNWNEPAIGFYKSLGARPMDTWTVYRMTGDSLNRLASESSPQR
ncbi:MAG TPA: GNAT family N-acetyltransferase [Bacteroidota bacterium]|nr:GNAT family N-acetyltransferase [Bacteroidota bacterium]